MITLFFYSITFNKITLFFIRLDHDQPSALVMLLEIADNSEGWKLVVETLIDVVPLNKPLGPSAITIIFDDSPLPAVNTVMAVS